jgi:hypothetical protein
MAAGWLTQRELREMGWVERADCMTRFEEFRFFTDFLDTVVVFLVKNEPNSQAFTPASELIAQERKLERLRAGWDGEQDVALQNMLVVW